MIILDSVSKSFGKKTIVQNISLHIKKGERVAIIGPSGTGKSTLLRLILGLTPPDTGSIYINNQNIVNMSEKKLKNIRMNCGMLFQSAALFDSMTVEENVGFMLKETLKLQKSQIYSKVKEMLSLVEMEGFEKHMPSDLSGGQKKRIGLARAIAAQPKIVLYDEPTTGLDPVLSTNIENLMVKLNQQLNMTSIIVTHQISTILRTSDKIYMLHNGSLLDPETPKTIYQSKNSFINNFIKGGLK